jgi:hypothetical protein
MANAAGGHADKQLQVGYVTPAGATHDQSVGQASYEGFRRAVHRLGLQGRVVEVGAARDPNQAVASLARQRYDLIVFAIGDPEAAERAARAFHKVRFLLSDIPVTALGGGHLKNVETFVLRVQEAGFLAGYLAVWLLFSLAAASAQLLLTGASMTLEGRIAPGLLLVATGSYQLSPIKSVCLRQCRAPAQFISRHWRPGTFGTFRLGTLHGAYCVGCCWLLMALLFVGGVMNFAWIAALALIVGIEKLTPRGEWIGRIAGVVLIGWGLWTIAGR